jgi:hypothetical protein
MPVLGGAVSVLHRRGQRILQRGPDCRRRERLGLRERAQRDVDAEGVFEELPHLAPADVGVWRRGFISPLCGGSMTAAWRSTSASSRASYRAMRLERRQASAEITPRDPRRSP